MEENNLSFTDIIFREMSKILLPLQSLKSKERVTDILLALGWELPNNMLLDVSFPSIIENINSLNNAIYDIEAANSTQDKLVQTIKLIGAIKSSVDAIYESSSVLNSALDKSQEFRENSGIVTEFPMRLLDYLVTVYLQSFYPKIYSIFLLVGLLGTEIKSNFTICKVWWDRVTLVFSNPKLLLNKTYDWDTNFKGDEFLSRLDLLMRSFLIPGGMYGQSSLESDDPSCPIVASGLRIPIYQEATWPENYEEVGINVSLLPKIDDNNLGGFTISPYTFGTDQSILELSSRWVLDFSGNTSLEKSLSIKIRPPKNINFEAIPPDSINLSEYSFRVELKEKKELIRKIILFGSESASHLSFEGIKLSLLASQDDQSKNYASEFDLGNISLVVTKGDGDGFLAKLLPAEPLEIKGNLILGFSSEKGFYISGGAGFEQTFEYLFQVQKSLGPIFIDTFDLALSTSDKDLALVTAVSGTANLGPVKVSLIKIGLETALDFSKPGLLGNADLSVGFKPPTGVGLEINSSSVRGAGGLIVENGNYSGWLDLEINKKISVQAICIITTHTPDGLKTFSFKILGFVEFPPVQIGFGFSISGVGLAVAINCCMNEEKLRSAVYDGSLQALLFPTNLIENAPQIIRDLNDFFPIQEDTYIIGAMAKLGWGGGNPIITADIGIFFEFGSNLRIALAGIAYAYLPNTEAPILSLKMQVLGLINFGNKTLSIDASLNGSKLMDWALDGDMALRSAWGDNARFALSIGGFYPGYKPPEGFPSLNRISLSIGTGNPKIQLLCYLAITENSVQIGAALILYWHKDYDWPVGNIEVEGVVGFDALFQFNPFYFETKIYAAFNLKRNGDDLMSIDLRLTLSGPNNYHAVGIAKIEICRVGITVKFDKEFGSKRPDIQQILSPTKILQQELDNEKNWFVRQLEDQFQDTILLEGQDTGNLVEPLGTVCFAQRAVPLQFRLDKIGQATPEGNDRWFDIVPQSGKYEPLTEFFAPGDFENLSDEEKVSGPAFEKMKGGIAITLDQEIECNMSVMKSRQVNYETSVQDAPANSSVKPTSNPLGHLQCYKTETLTRKISGVGRKLHTTKPLLLKELDTANSYHVKEQEIAAVNDEFKSDYVSTTYSQARQKFKDADVVKSAIYIVDAAKVHQ